ncbi:MAG: transposase, partial [Deferrisomatales bacterium]|nr:transposase [Deferrisomatales bacterium]
RVCGKDDTEWLLSEQYWAYRARMPRQPRLDLPGLLHHVMARGIERREIFGDDRDRERFCERLGELVIAAGARLHAWCLLSNHFHLVIRSGERPLPWLMQRLMTGHAVRYNLRHGRSGHLFQNRYKSVVVEEEPYFLELVRYVALNPVRAGLVREPAELDHYPWSGHAVLVARRAAPWQDTEEVLARFGRHRARAIARYRDFVIDGWDQGHRNELTGGGMVRSAGGLAEVLRRKPEEREAADERILGSGRFVEAIWRAREEGMSGAPRRGWQEILQEVAERFEVDQARILRGVRSRAVARARGAFFSRCVEEAGTSMTQLGRLCGLSTVSVSRSIDKARRRGDVEKR